jgi:hypothetical protein
VTHRTHLKGLATCTGHTRLEGYATLQLVGYATLQLEGYATLQLEDYITLQLVRVGYVTLQQPTQAARWQTRVEHT